MSVWFKGGESYNELKLKHKYFKKKLSDVFPNLKEDVERMMRIPSPQITSSEFWASAATTNAIEMGIANRKIFQQMNWRMWCDVLISVPLIIMTVYHR